MGEVRLPAGVARHRMELALSETDHAHLGPHLTVGPCSVCGLSCVQIHAEVGMGLSADELAAIERAVQITFGGDGELRVQGPLRPGRTRCSCASLFAGVDEP